MEPLLIFYPLLDPFSASLFIQYILVLLLLTAAYFFVEYLFIPSRVQHAAKVQDPFNYLLGRVAVLEEDLNSTCYSQVILDGTLWKVALDKDYLNCSLYRGDKVLIKQYLAERTVLIVIPLER